ncbi:hypothetical protein BU26DRAFT_260055 [Trematosphaeria pertusa]|uniref:Uncharacterized protein n=1 Tax=Trematosphaeria pertusa TaxID=390896 RepID=A0A6A6IR08_9PLEO|nr:uncharacterized protein BU26DRAFT_260055 [Trematosphaeria pertusa]KAF2252617.1 hypothetical protein BU26DRAFT_260055 [Trematosphaeria pertusa]
MDIRAFRPNRVTPSALVHRRYQLRQKATFSTSPARHFPTKSSPLLPSNKPRHPPVPHRPSAPIAPTPKRRECSSRPTCHACNPCCPSVQHGFGESSALEVRDERRVVQKGARARRAQGGVQDGVRHEAWICA